MEVVGFSFFLDSMSISFCGCTYSTLTLGGLCIACISIAFFVCSNEAVKTFKAPKLRPELAQASGAAEL